MIPLARPWFGPEESKAVDEVLASGWVAQGPTTAAFEEEFAAAMGVPHAVAVSSCTTGLHLAIVAAGIGPGDEVILPSYTFPATANAVLYAGGTPVLVDVEPETLNLDVAQAEQAIGPRTRAIIGVHLFGFPCDVDGVRELCRTRRLTFVEDAACAIGTRWRGELAGGLGDMGCFSFHARKVVTCGEGGMLTTADDHVAELFRSLRTHGVDRSAATRHAEGAAPTDASYLHLGYNYRLSDIQAAVGRVQLRRLEGFVSERERLAARYDEALGDLPALRLPPRHAEARHSYQSYVVVLEDDAPLSAIELMRGLADQGISTRVGTYAVHRQPYLADRARVPFPLPATDQAARSSVALPLFNGLTIEDQDRVIEALGRAWKSRHVTG